MAMPRINGTPEERLTAKVKVLANGCWEFIGHVRADGYGHFGLHGRVRLAHIAAYIIFKGPVPAGLMVRHKCDFKPCCNPDHLELGTAKQNAEDRVERGQQRHGEGHGCAKLTEANVREIRKRRVSGETLMALGKEFHVRETTILALCTGKTWKHIPHENPD